MKVVFDIETDHVSIVKVKNIWCVVAKIVETGEVLTFRDPYKAVEFLKTADVLIAHNGIMYDLPVLQRLVGFKFEEWPKTIDTLILSRLFYNNTRDRHSLDSWGETLGNYKIEYKDFSGFSQEMLDYCIQDVEVTNDLFTYIRNEWDLKSFSRAINIEMKFARIISQQVLNGFPFDTDKALQLVQQFDLEIKELSDQLLQIMPQVRDLTAFRTANKDGRVISETEKGYWYLTPSKKEERFKEWKYDEPNPHSRQQIVEMFKSKGWEPKEKTEKGTPIVDETILESLPYPEAKLFARLFRLNKQRSMIKSEETNGNGWISYLVGDRIHGNVNTNAAITGRCTHSSPNVSQVDRKNIEMRKCWKARDGWELISVDADALEFRLLASELSRYDGGALTETIENGKKENGTDIHSRNQRAVGLNKRDSAKTFIYAMIYGAGDKKLGLTFTEDQGLKNPTPQKLMYIGKGARAKLMDAMTGMKELILEDFMGLDGRPLWPRSAHAKLNTRIQSAGAVVMKLGLINFYMLANKAGYVHMIDWGLTANVHDEIVFEVRPELSEIMRDICVRAIEMTTEQFNLGCPIRAQGQIGKNWGEIH